MNASLAILLVLPLSLLTACGESTDPAPSKLAPPELAISGATMGTTFHIKLSELPQDQSLDLIEAHVNALLTRLDLLMSTYQDESEVSRFNRQSDTDWFPVSRETLNVITHAQQISAVSQGKFDITVGPLIDLWKFGRSRELAAIPSDSQIERARQQVGFRKLEFADNPPRIRKLTDQIQIDLSAIAKGYAVDCVADYLSSLPISGYMVEIGGEIRTTGQTQDGKPWTIGIESPQTNKRMIHRTVALNDHAMASSGNYRNYHEVNGKQYGHTIDPTTGRPANHETVSVTVIADTCMHADAMATTLMVLGADKGIPLAESQGMAVLFITNDATGTLTEQRSSAFESFIAKAIER